MFSIEMLPAAQGDSLWIEYGPDADHIKRILIDTGTLPTYDITRERILALDENDRRFELLVITHVDSDHIEGAIPLLQDQMPGLEWGEVWFNGYEHVSKFVPADKMGTLQGEYLSVLIKKAGIPWNRSFDNGPIVVLPDAKLPHANIGGMKLTVLSPTPERMRKLAAQWKDVLEDEGLTSDAKTLAKLKAITKYRPEDALGHINVEKLAEADADVDTTAANGSTITLLAEYDGKTALLAGDAWASVLVSGLQHLNAERKTNRVELDVLKVPHHGSVRNMSQELLEQIKCSRYLFSTSGATHEHPDEAGVARVIAWGGSRLKLYFNYRSVSNEMWDDEQLQDDYRYSTIYPADGERGLRVDV
jgi:beta-lactamase superfamily II metal-dependent hydrolase